MFILVSTKRIEKLEKRIRELETTVSDLRESTMIESKIPLDCFWGMSPLPATPVKNVIKQILDHLDMDVVFRPGRKAEFTLIPKKVKTKKK